MRIKVVPKSLEEGELVKGPVAPSHCEMKYFDDDGNDISHLFDKKVFSLDIRLRPDEPMKVTLGLYLTEFDVSQLADTLHPVPLPGPDKDGYVDATTLGSEYREKRRMSED